MAINLALPTGSSSDPQGLHGRAHLCEHLAYAGLSPQHARAYPGLVQSRGGRPGALTAHDRTHYHALLPADQVDLGLWIEANRLRTGAALPDPEILIRERSVLLQERAQHVENPPYGRLFEDLHQELYPAPHPYHHLPMGTREGLEAITASDCQTYLQSSLTPGDATLVVAGDFSLAAMRGQIEDLFGDLQGGPRTLSPDFTEDSSDCEWRVRVEEEAPFARTLLAFRAPGEGMPGFHAAQILAAALAGGASLPLEQDLVHDRQLAQSVEAGLIEMRNASTLVVDAIAVPGIPAHQLENALAEGVEACFRESFPEPAVESARRRLLMDLATEVDELDSRAELLARLALLGSGGSLAAELEAYHRVEPSDLRDLIDHSFQPKQRLLLTIEPKGESL